MNSRLLTMTAIATVAGSLAMAGCNKPDPNAVRDNGDSTMARTDQKARQLGNDAKDTAQKMGNKVDDAVITTTVKTEIAKDSELSAMQVSVDTDNGRVALHGTAPSMAAKEHATTLAAGVKGVASVDNQLTVDPTKK